MPNLKKDTTANTPTNFTPTKGQESALNQFKKFLDDPDCKINILRGYAGTGKTTITNAYIEEMEKRNLNFVLLASTGRAAKILANATNREASTVHGLIYKFSDLNQDMEKLVDKDNKPVADATGQLFLNFELCSVNDDLKRIYLVDEASMISDIKDPKDIQANYGSGRLLTDLLAYDPNGKFVFIGDACQLPPVSQDISPALSADYFETCLGLKVMSTELTEIVRQGEGNDIARAAQLLRKLYLKPQPYKWAKFPLKGFKNIHIVSSTAELYKRYIETVQEKGFNEATLLSFSNRQCSMVTDIVRPAMGIKVKNLSVGDLLLVTQNNYISGLMNGDLVTVEEISDMERRAGLTFLKVRVKEMFTEKEYTQWLIKEVLEGGITNLNAEQQKQLYIDFFIRMKKKGIKQKSHAFSMLMMSDPYLNAIRAVYGYALTCHKAQGGEWNKVFLDIPKDMGLKEKPYVYQWVYTAMTRARQDLYIVDGFWLTGQIIPITFRFNNH